MDIGISTACFYPMATESTLSVIYELGFKKIEVFMEAYSEYEVEFCKYLREQIDKFELKVISAHAFCSVYEPFLFSEYRRRKLDALVTFKKALTAAHILGAKYFTFHGNRKEATTDTFNFRNYASEMDQLAEIAGEKNIVLAWENVYWCQSGSPDFIEKTMEYIRSDNLKFTLDIKQANKSGVNPIEYINVMKDKIVNVHINDADHEHVCLLPGEGKINLKLIIHTLKQNNYQGDLLIEVYRKNFRHMHQIIESRNHLATLI
ncbi:MAG: hypothetical protein PWP27_69 [Clostridiales bacterium]|jgi:sugar phosphate isomerase/epimerase|nr:hypothetical protein [Clostridiales bacterium]MDK2932259.1 hypothetical protein [Clostridiales bacterium]